MLVSEGEGFKVKLRSIKFGKNYVFKRKRGVEKYWKIISLKRFLVKCISSGLFKVGINHRFSLATILICTLFYRILFK